MNALSAADDLAHFRRGAVDLVEERDLAARLAKARAAGRGLRVKFGMDPSSPDLHVGHAVQLMKLRALQQAGHTIVLIVGDATAMVGDPSGRNKLRPQLSRADVEANLVTYTAQAGKVLDMTRTEVHRNSEWFDAMRFEDVLRLASKATVARMLERDTFEKRMEAKEPIGVHEFLYPLMQGWDSVMIRSDVELGGTDQLFNLLVGRDLQEKENQAPQICMTLPLINGLDGRKMSKSYGNAIAFTDSPAEMFGKVMSLRDDVMGDWFRLLTGLDEGEIATLLGGHFREAKARLGEEIASFFHGRDAGRAARDGFDRQFRDKELPTDIPVVEYAKPWPADGVPLAVLLREIGLCASSSDARRLIEGGGVKLDGAVVADVNARIARPTAELLLQAGKRKFAKLRAQ
ncbi:MAG: tyrosine--tRNA ligase [Planctomycetes bacterium]|nr:tyrosine--tRNA ligase [Planctomycetota bacterium]